LFYPDVPNAKLRLVDPGLTYEHIVLKADAKGLFDKITDGIKEKSSQAMNKLKDTGKAIQEKFKK